MGIGILQLVFNLIFFAIPLRYTVLKFIDKPIASWFGPEAVAKAKELSR